MVPDPEGEPETASQGEQQDGEDAENNSRLSEIDGAHENTVQPKPSDTTWSPTKVSKICLEEEILRKTYQNNRIKSIILQISKENKISMFQKLALSQSLIF